MIPASSKTQRKRTLTHKAKNFDAVVAKKVPHLGTAQRQMRQQ